MGPSCRTQSIPLPPPFLPAVVLCLSLDFGNIAATKTPEELEEEQEAEAAATAAEAEAMPKKGKGKPRIPWEKYNGGDDDEVPPRELDQVPSFPPTPNLPLPTHPHPWIHTVGWPIIELLLFCGFIFRRGFRNTHGGIRDFEKDSLAMGQEEYHMCRGWRVS